LEAFGHNADLCKYSRPPGRRFYGRRFNAVNTLYEKIGKRLVYARAGLNRWAWRLVAEPKPAKWLFIVGCYNSGTTLLHNLLSQHPAIGSMPLEGRQFTRELPLAEAHGLRRLWALKPELFYLDESGGAAVDVRKIKRQWAFMYNDPRRPVLMEKSIVNAARTRWLQRHFPNSHFIVLMRNGYAVAEGIRRKENHPVDKGILQWKNSYEILLADMPHLANKLYLTYEALTAAPEESLGRICAFLGIGPMPPGTGQGAVKVHGERNPVTDMNPASIARLSDGEKRIIRELAGDLLEKTGYAPRAAGQPAS
jgi:hypothetical protein